jgi:uncharacterized membrane protein YcaP (DUF421 family)
MGKRQIGELELSELITTLLISEIASLPITESNIPISLALIPISTLLLLELISSLLIVRSPRMSRLLTTRPITLIKDGMMLQKNMKKAKISTEELICELRMNGMTDIKEVMYAILEQNGKICVIPKVSARPPTSDELKISISESGIYHIVIDKSVINRHALCELGLSEEDIYLKLKKSRIKLNDVFLMIMNDSGEFQIVRKE